MAAGPFRSRFVERLNKPSQKLSQKAAFDLLEFDVDEVGGYVAAGFAERLESCPPREYGRSFRRPGCERVFMFHFFGSFYRFVCMLLR